MNTTITLPSGLAETLQREATQEGKTLEALVTDWLNRQRIALNRQRLAEQTHAFWGKHSELYTQYPNQYVAFYDGQVLDHAADVRALALRVRAQYGDLPIVISQVTNPLRPTYKVISSRLQVQYT